MKTYCKINLHLSDCIGLKSMFSIDFQQSQINDWEELFNRLTIFIMDCNGEQIRYAAQSFAELCHLFAEQLIKVVLTKRDTKNRQK